MASPGDSRTRENDAVFASVDAPADVAREWLTAQFDAQASRGDADALSPAQRLDLTELLSSTWWRAVFEDERDDDAEAPDHLLRRALPPAVRAAARLPLGGVILALYMRNLVNDAWAMAWDHELLVVAIETACDAAVAARGGDRAPEDDLGALAWALLRFMLCEFRVETALLTGRLDVVVDVSDAAVAAVAPLVEAVRAQPSGAARHALLREASNEETYYRSVRDSARIGRRMLRGDRRSAARDLARIRSDIASASFNHMDASELRGHLAAIERLEAVREREWLHVDDGRVRIVYSFGIRTGVWDDPIGLVAALHEDAVAMRDAGRTLGGLDIVEARARLDLSDVWQGTDNFGRGYRGATIRLADIRLERSDDGTPLETVHTRIQLSQLGNHSIVFDIDLHDAPAYRVAEAVHLATPVFGDLTEIDGMLRMRVSGDRTVSGLPEVVDDLLEGLRSMLDGIAGAVDGTRLAAREGSFGIVATIVAASRIGPHGSTALTDTRGLLDLWGVQPLVHPLPSGAASIADWALYDLDAVETWSLLHLNSELLASNSNVTLLAAFGSPDFAVQEMESYIEFAHSMHGMYQGWQDGVRYFAERIARLLSEAEIVLRRTDELDDRREYALSTQRAEAIADLDRLVREVERTELSLQAFVQSNEAIMLFIESPSMVTSPPLRTDLDTILDSNGYPHLRDGFTRAVRDVLGTRLQPLLEVVHRRMEHAYAAERALIEQQRRDLEEQAERQREERDRRNGRVFEVLGIVFAVVGFSGLASVLQTGYPDWGGPVAWWLVAIVLALAAATGVALAVLSGRRILRRPDRDAERPEESDP